MRSTIASAGFLQPQEAPEGALQHARQDLLASLAAEGPSARPTSGFDLLRAYEELRRGRVDTRTEVGPPAGSPLSPTFAVLAPTIPNYLPAPPPPPSPPPPGVESPRRPVSQDSPAAQVPAAVTASADVPLARGVGSAAAKYSLRGKIVGGAPVRVNPVIGAGGTPTTEPRQPSHAAGGSSAALVSNGAPLGQPPAAAARASAAGSASGSQLPGTAAPARSASARGGVAKHRLAQAPQARTGKPAADLAVPRDQRRSAGGGRGGVAAGTVALAGGRGGSPAGAVAGANRVGPAAAANGAVRVAAARRLKRQPGVQLAVVGKGVGLSQSPPRDGRPVGRAVTAAALPAADSGLVAPPQIEVAVGPQDVDGSSPAGTPQAGTPPGSRAARLQRLKDLRAALPPSRRVTGGSETSDVIALLQQQASDGDLGLPGPRAAAPGALVHVSAGTGERLQRPPGGVTAPQPRNGSAPAVMSTQAVGLWWAGDRGRAAPQVPPSFDPSTSTLGIDDGHAAGAFATSGWTVDSEPSGISDVLLHGVQRPYHHIFNDDLPSSEWSAPPSLEPSGYTVASMGTDATASSDGWALEAGALNGWEASAATRPAIRVGGTARADAAAQVLLLGAEPSGGSGSEGLLPVPASTPSAPPRIAQDASTQTAAEAATAAPRDVVTQQAATVGQPPQPWQGPDMVERAPLPSIALPTVVNTTPSPQSQDGHRPAARMADSRESSTASDDGSQVSKRLALSERIRRFREEPAGPRPRGGLPTGHAGSPPHAPSPITAPTATVHSCSGGSGSSEPVHASSPRRASPGSWDTVRAPPPRRADDDDDSALADVDAVAAALLARSRALLRERDEIQARIQATLDSCRPPGSSARAAAPQHRAPAWTKPPSPPFSGRSSSAVEAAKELLASLGSPGAAQEQATGFGSRPAVSAGPVALPARPVTQPTALAHTNPAIHRPIPAGDGASGYSSAQLSSSATTPGAPLVSAAAAPMVSWRQRLRELLDQVDQETHALLGKPRGSPQAPPPPPPPSTWASPPAGQQPGSHGSEPGHMLPTPAVVSTAPGLPLHSDAVVSALLARLLGQGQQPLPAASAPSALSLNNVNSTGDGSTGPSVAREPLSSTGKALMVGSPPAVSHGSPAGISPPGLTKLVPEAVASPAPAVSPESLASQVVGKAVASAGAAAAASPPSAAPTQPTAAATVAGGDDGAELDSILRRLAAKFGMAEAPSLTALLAPPTPGPTSLPSRVPTAADAVGSSGLSSTGPCSGPEPSAKADASGTAQQPRPELQPHAVLVSAGAAAAQPPAVAEEREVDVGSPLAPSGPSMLSLVVAEAPETVRGLSSPPASPTASLDGVEAVDPSSNRLAVAASTALPMLGLKLRIPTSMAPWDSGGDQALPCTSSPPVPFKRSCAPDLSSPESAASVHGPTDDPAPGALAGLPPPLPPRRSTDSAEAGASPCLGFHPPHPIRILILPDDDSAATPGGGLQQDDVQPRRRLVGGTDAQTSITSPLTSVDSDRSVWSGGRVAHILSSTVTGMLFADSPEGSRSSTPRTPPSRFGTCTLDPPSSGPATSRADSPSRPAESPARVEGVPAQGPRHGSPMGCRADGVSNGGSLQSSEKCDAGEAKPAPQSPTSPTAVSPGETRQDGVVRQAPAVVRKLPDTAAVTDAPEGQVAAKPLRDSSALDQATGGHGGAAAAAKGLAARVAGETDSVAQQTERLAHAGPTRAAAVEFGSPAAAVPGGMSSIAAEPGSGSKKPEAIATGTDIARPISSAPGSPASHSLEVISTPDAARAGAVAGGVPLGGTSARVTPQMVDPGSSNLGDWAHAGQGAVIDGDGSDSGMIAGVQRMHWVLEMEEPVPSPAYEETDVEIVGEDDGEDSSGGPGSPGATDAAPNSGGTRSLRADLRKSLSHLSADAVAAALSRSASSLLSAEHLLLVIDASEEGDGNGKGDGKAAADMAGTEQAPCPDRSPAASPSLTAQPEPQPDSPAQPAGSLPLHGDDGVEAADDQDLVRMVRERLGACRQELLDLHTQMTSDMRGR